MQCSALKGLGNSSEILVVDDNLDLCEFVCDILELNGYPCRFLTASKQVANKVDKDTKLLLLDICMPDMDGIEVINEISTLDHQPDIILMSGSGAENIAITSLLAEFKNIKLLGVLEKPFRENDLLGMIEKYHKNLQSS